MQQIAVILTDADQYILWVNQDFEALTGYTLPEVVGQNPGRLLQGPHTEPDAIARIRQGIAGRTSFKATVTNYRKNGEEYLCKLVVHPIFGRDKQLTNYLAFEVDGNKVKNENRLPMMNLNSRYRTSSLRGYQELRLYDRIQELMEAEKAYLDAELTLRSLADRLETNTKYLSQVINRYGECNFLSFVNGYRIDSVLERMRKGEQRNKTYYALAQLCGFKNKSTFYKVFRDVTGHTPKVYADKMSRGVLN